MQIIIKTKNIELTENLESLIQKRMASLKKFIHDENTEFLVEIEKETSRHQQGDVFVAEVIINLPGKKLIAKAHSDDLLKSITEVKEEMEEELRKYKTKKIEIPRRKARKTNPEENF